MSRLLPLALLLLLATAARAEDWDPKVIYEQRCAFCHGTDGKGSGPAGAALQPPPPDFTNAEFWKMRNADKVRQAIAAGKPGTSMIGFGTTLKKDEIEALVVLVGKFKPAVP